MLIQNEKIFKGEPHRCDADVLNVGYKRGSKD